MLGTPGSNRRRARSSLNSSVSSSVSTSNVSPLWPLRATPMPRARPGEWLRSDCWARLARTVGVVKAVIAEHDRDTDQGRARGIGVALSAHRDETFAVETEEETLRLKLERTRRRFDPGVPTTRYRFAVVSRTPAPE